MKKVLLVLLQFLIISFCFCKNNNSTENSIREDLDIFQEIIESAYVCFDEINEQNKIKFDKSNMLNIYKKNLKWREKNNFNDCFVNGINQEALVIPLYTFFQNYNFEDGHLCICTNENNWFPSQKNWYYFSDCYFKKSGDEYYVLNSQDGNLEGKKFTGNIEDLKRTIKNKEEIYVFSPIMPGSFDSTNISLENKNYKIPIYENPRFRNKDVLGLFESDKSLYLRISSFNYIEGTDDDKTFMNTLQEISNIQKNKDFIILDVRGNSGGVEYYPRRLLEVLYNNGDVSKNDDISIFLNKADSGIVELHSDTISRQEYLNALETNQSAKMINYYKEQYDLQLENGEKYYTNSNKNLQDSLSQYSDNSLKAKIIIIADNYTASMAEKFIGYLYMMNKDNVIIVGENTSGTFTYGGSITYELPNSKIKLILASQSYKNTEILNLVDSWHGENLGFFPDYWLSNNNLNEILYYLTADENLCKTIIY